MAIRSDPEGRCDTQDFFTLTPGWGTKYYFASVDTGSVGDASTDWSYRKLANFKGVAVLNVVSGTSPGDFIRNDTLLMVVSKRLLDILRAYNVSEFATFRVRIVHKGKETTGYSGLAVLGKGGRNDPSMVTYLDDPKSTSKSRRIDGLCPTAWDGSDLFTLDDMYRVVLATDRVRQIFRKEKVTNCLFEPAEEFKIPF